MGFKLPHDVVSTCAKRDEPPSRRQPLELSPFWISYTHQNSSDFVGVCGEAFCFFSVFSGLQKMRVNSCPFVVENQRFGCGKGRSKSIRVHSWFLYEKATNHNSRNVWPDNP